VCPLARGSLGFGGRSGQRPADLPRQRHPLPDPADGSARAPISLPSIANATLSPDGAKIAFDYFEGGFPRTVYVMSADGGGARPVATAPQAEVIAELSWSPDSTRLAYLLRGDTGESLRIVDVDSGAEVPVIADGLGKTLLAWSPDGRGIAFSGWDRAGPLGLRVKDLATGAVRTLSTSSSTVSPSWSPDGRLIAFADRSGGEWVVRPDGGAPRRVDVAVTSPQYPSAPVWSPDGRALYYSQAVSTGPYTKFGAVIRYGLFTANVDGSGQHVVADDLTPIGWSPAGDALVVARASYRAGVFFVRPDGRCLTFVTEGSFVGWRPAASASPPFECVDLTVHATAPTRSASTGATFQLSVGNAGTQPARATLVQRFDQSVKPLGHDGRCSYDGRSFSYRCRLDDVEPGVQQSVTLAVRADPGILKSSVEVSPAGRDSNPETNTASTVTRVYPCSILGTDGPDTLRGTRRGDVVCGLSGDDHLYPGGGADVVRAGPGDDVIDAAGGGRDVISCGPGADLVVADRSDHVSGDCERVVRTRG
jgi:Tol biopolymer transport system component